MIPGFGKSKALDIIVIQSLTGETSTPREADAGSYNVTFRPQLGYNALFPFSVNFSIQCLLLSGLSVLWLFLTLTRDLFGSRFL